MQSFFNFCGTLATFAALAVFWNHYYVKPADDFRIRMIKCMHHINNDSLEGYQVCHEQERSKNDH